jgi:UDP-N-acetyl-D-glucosamine dehydrogenase
MELLRAAGADLSYHDPHVPALDERGLRSVALEPEAYDAVVVVTDHSGIDYENVTERAGVVVDLRNATGVQGRQNGKVWKL